MLSRANRITKEVFPLLRKNKVYEGDFFSFKVRFLEEGHSNTSRTKITAIISKKVTEKAVKRNKIKRQVYGATETLLREKITQKNCLIAIYAKKEVVYTTYTQIEKDISLFFTKIIH